MGLEVAHHGSASEAIAFWEVFRRASFGDRNLFAASQAGLVNNLNDGMSWGIFPLFFAAFGLSIERIGILKAIYPAVWGVLQTITGPLSDRWGRKGLIVAGMWVQAIGLFVTAVTRNFGWWFLASVLLGLGTAMADAHCLRVRCLPSLMAGALTERLPLLARSRLCDRGALRRHHGRPVRRCLGDCRYRCSDSRFGWRSRGHHDGAPAGEGDG